MDEVRVEFNADLGVWCLRYFLNDLILGTTYRKSLEDLVSHLRRACQQIREEGKR